jgi:signal transduction histidine kinase/putative methionine-R-sulfoxide reductase with GAF domain
MSQPQRSSATPGLKARLARRDAHLAVLAEISSRLHSEDDPQQILETTLDAILRGLKLKTAWIFLGDQKERRLHLAAHRGVAERYLEEVRQKGLEDCLCPEVFWTGHRMLARNTTQCPRMPHLVEGLEAPVAHACIPLLFEGESRGVLNVAAPRGELFSEDDLQFLETVGHQLCLAVERATHLRAERARIQEARALAAINRAIGASLKIEDVLQAVGETARELLDADRVLALLGSEPTHMSVAHITGLPHPELHRGQALDLVASGARLLHQALVERGRFRVERWDTDPRVNGDLAKRWGVGAALVHCLTARGRTLGLLVVTRVEPHRWSAQATEIAEALASQASVALENARLYEEGRRAYQELKDAQARIIQTEKLAAVGTFASGLAHEVRNPLNSVALQLSLLERRTAPLEPRLAGEIKELIGIIREEVRRLDGLVSDFLELSRASRIQHRPTNLDVLIDDVVRLLRPEARAGGVTLRRQQLGDTAPSLALDGEKMKQVVINLVRNAIEAMPEGGVVVIESGLVDGAVQMRISDTGPGLPEGLDVFQLFVTTKAQGTGLGLAIAQQIVLEHGGELLAESQTGRGTTFTVRLPARPVASETRAEERRT